MANMMVKNTEVTVLQINNEDYICITDMIKAKDGDFFVSDWLRNRNTLEYVEIWEKINNKDFNYGEFAIIKNQAGLNNFKISIKELVEKTNIICLKAKSGRYGVRKTQTKKAICVILRALSSCWCLRIWRATMRF